MNPSNKSTSRPTRCALVYRTWFSWPDLERQPSTGKSYQCTFSRHCYVTLNDSFISCSLTNTTFVSMLTLSEATWPHPPADGHTANDLLFCPCFCGNWQNHREAEQFKSELLSCINILCLQEQSSIDINGRLHSSWSFCWAVVFVTECRCSVAVHMRLHESGQWRRVIGSKLRVHMRKMDEKKGLFSPLLTMKEGLLRLYYCWIGRESWHAIKKHFNLPFLILKVRYPAIS